MPLRRCLDADHDGCAGWAQAPDSLCGPCRRRRKARRNGDRRVAAEVKRAAAVCVICGEGPRRNDPWTLEHRVPVSAGGSSDAGNVGAAHLSCNSRKRDR